ncbi:MAG: DUF5683 domain-containing protein [Chitinophagaceae bacterium]
MKHCLTLFIACLVCCSAICQQKPLSTTDSSRKAVPAAHVPKKATLRSAILPGWGQAYNKKYWKIPLVYGALGTCVGVFFYNTKEYTAARNAYRYLSDADPLNDALVQQRFTFIPLESIRVYRNSVRRNVDYSVLAFLLCWGLNVVDATVDAHLLQFEVSPDLSMKVRPNFDPLTRSGALSLSLQLNNKSAR